MLIALTLSLIACEDPTLYSASAMSELFVETTPAATFRSSSTLTTTLEPIIARDWRPVRVSVMNRGSLPLNISSLCLLDTSGSCVSQASVFRLCGGRDDTPIQCSEVLSSMTLKPSQGAVLTLLFEPTEDADRQETASLLIESDAPISRFIVNVEASSCRSTAEGLCVGADDQDADVCLMSKTTALM